MKWLGVTWMLCVYLCEAGGGGYGRSGGKHPGRDNSRQAIPRSRPEQQYPPTQTVRLEVAVVNGDRREGEDFDHGHRRQRGGDGHRRRHHDRDGHSRTSRRTSRSTSKRRPRKQKSGRKAKKRSSSSSSSSSSESPSSIRRRKPPKSKGRKAKAAEDALASEISKLREEMARHQKLEPSTPTRKPAIKADGQWTPKTHAHIGSLCTFACDGEVMTLLEPTKVTSWTDVEEQLRTHPAPTLKKFLATKVASSNVPRTKPAMITAILKLMGEALRG